jgi:hypothetical protein
MYQAGVVCLMLIYLGTLILSGSRFYQVWFRPEQYLKRTKAWAGRLAEFKQYGRLATGDLTLTEARILFTFGFVITLAFFVACLWFTLTVVGFSG